MPNCLPKMPEICLQEYCIIKRRKCACMYMGITDFYWFTENIIYIGIQTNAITLSHILCENGQKDMKVLLYCLATQAF